MSDSLRAWQTLVLWHNWRKTALFFVFTLTLLLDMATNPVISVVSVAGAITISLSISYCCYVWGMRKLRKSCNAEHPLKRYLDMDVTISRKTTEQLAHLLVSKLNPLLLRLRSLFLVEDMLDSLKMLLIFCCLNIVGDLIKGMTLLIVGKCMSTASVDLLPNSNLSSSFHSTLHLAQSIRVEEEGHPQEARTISTLEVSAAVHKP